MSIRLPLALRVTRRALVRGDTFFATILDAVRPAPSVALFAFHAFAFKNDERSFARELLERRTELWLFRSNQRAFCGDFVAVDMSSPEPSLRRAFVLELKLGERLRVGRGGVQLRNAADAVRDAGRGGVLGAGAGFEVLTGDARNLLGYLEEMTHHWKSCTAQRRPSGIVNVPHATLVDRVSTMLL
jgi:hypothetical protein